MTNIVVISGKKQSGKSTLANYISGYVLKQKGKLRDWNIDEDGNLRVYTELIDKDGVKKSGLGVLDLCRKDKAFQDYALQNIWPHVKTYSFADELKIFLMNVFGLTYEQCYGTNEQKNSPTALCYSNISSFINPHEVKRRRIQKTLDEKISARTLMQVFGTNICRKMYPLCWVESCFRAIAAERPALAVVSDCRFQDELEASKKVGAKTIRLTGQFVEQDEEPHQSEIDMDGLGEDAYDLVVHNQNLSIETTAQTVLDFLIREGMIEVGI